LLDLLTASIAIAYDFSAVAPSGQTLYYNITDATNSYVDVAYPGTSSSDPYSVFTAPIGDLTIPSSVNYNGTTYSVTGIGDWAFYNCSGLTSVSIGDSVTSIGSSAFYNCSNILSVGIGKSVAIICPSAFYGCSNVDSLYYNASNIINTISWSGNSWGFRPMSNLRVLVIGDSVHVIPSRAFENSYQLTKVTIGSSVTTISSNAFSGCYYVDTLIYNARNITTNLGSVFPNSLSVLVFGESVNVIPRSAFRYQINITSITIPNSVTSIGAYAFSECTGLASLTIGDSVAIIGEYAFLNCRGLSSLNIPNMVTNIGERSFSGCSGLTNVIFGESVVSIENSAFSYCSSLVNITFCNSLDSIGNYAFDNCSGLTSVTIPNSVTSIGDYAFNGCVGLTNVTIGNSVTGIGSSAFSGCSGLTSVSIPNSVTIIGSGAFNNCSGLASVSIGDSVTSIGNSAFYHCSGLTSVSIPNSVTTIGDYAFCHCSSLANVSIGNSVTCIWFGAFEGCSNVDSLYYNARNLITEECWYLGNSSENEKNGFRPMSNLRVLVIGDSVRVIPAGAFYNQSHITSVTVPNLVTSIGEKAFYGCSEIDSITTECQIAPLFGVDAFSGVDMQIPVIIPCGSQASYYSRWPYFTNFVESQGNSFSANSADESQGSVSVLTEPTCSNPHGVLYASASVGYAFSHWNNGCTDNPYSFELTQDTVITAYFIVEGAEGVNVSDLSKIDVIVRGCTIEVEGAEGQSLAIVDAIGRALVNEKVVASKTYQMPASGVYLVKVANHPAQRVVVVK